jgi:JNK1/MAPK8-associated membrane protein
MMLYWSAILEVGLSAVLTVFLSEPMFSFDIYSCGVGGFSDWYTYLFNPSPRYESVLICTQERVYPLQTMVLVFYVFCVTFMLLFRPIINERVKPAIANPSLAIYHALYAFPLLALVHSLFGGPVYFSFPYLSIIISCGANAGHFAMKLDQTTKSLLITSVTDMRNIIIIGKRIENLEGLLID